MSKVLILNHQNNMGDAICMMRGIKEWKQRHNHVIDFMSPHAMHLEAAWHTDDLFHNVSSISQERMEELMRTYLSEGYEQIFHHFNMDWTNSTKEGIVRSYCKLNFGFYPSTDRPYFVPQYDELKITKYIADRLRGVGWKKLAMVQALAVSNPARNIPFDDIREVIEMFPTDTMILMPCGVHDPFHVTMNPFPKNFIAMPGYPVGHTAALMKLMDLNLMVHGAYSHLAYAVGAPNVVQLNFYATGSINFAVPGGTNLNFESNEDDYMPALKAEIDRILIG